MTSVFLTTPQRIGLKHKGWTIGQAVNVAITMKKANHKSDLEKAEQIIEHPIYQDKLKQMVKIALRCNKLEKEIEEMKENGMSTVR